ncbi:IclR family transcriptional regulator [Halosimplex aquaticum]|uniref:IclR family transcriptional regulator n=1 Tax=Halosimplex aquaticum TaxID=3026162 RepID=A0ABD5Y0U3_9EURY|nr:IclR family transcriptional regulator [Halosimplex aquaticum]
MNNDGPSVKATETSFRIIEALEREGGAGVSELARAVDLSKSAVYKHVQTLERLGYLVRDGDDYYLSNRFRSLASRASERFPVEVLREVVEDLAETTGHVANFIAHEGRNGIYVVCVDDYSDSKSATTEGDTAPFHATAGGKAILAFLSESERDRILQRVGTPAYTDKTITDREELERELQTVRDQRIAFDREEYVAGHQCVASPILGQNREPVGALSVSGDISQMSGKRLAEDVTGLVISSARSIENELLSGER